MYGRSAKASREGSTPDSVLILDLPRKVGPDLGPDGQPTLEFVCTHFGGTVSILLPQPHSSLLFQRSNLTWTKRNRAYSAKLLCAQCMLPSLPHHDPPSNGTPTLDPGVRIHYFGIPKHEKGHFPFLCHD